MDEDLLYQMLSDPQMAAALAAMGSYGDRQALEGQQAERGQGLYATPTAQGRQVGNTYVAASPWEHLGVAAQKALGAKQLGDAVSQQRALLQQDMATRQRFGSSLADAMRRSRQAQPQAFDPRDAGWYSGIDNPDNYG